MISLFSWVLCFTFRLSFFWGDKEPREGGRKNYINYLFSSSFQLNDDGRERNKYFIFPHEKRKRWRQKSSGKMLICGKFAEMRVACEIREVAQAWRRTKEEADEEREMKAIYFKLLLPFIFNNIRRIWIWKENQPPRKMLSENLLRLGWVLKIGTEDIPLPRFSTITTQKYDAMKSHKNSFIHGNTQTLIWLQHVWRHLNENTWKFERDKLEMLCGGHTRRVSTKDLSQKSLNKVCGKLSNLRLRSLV